MIKLLRKKGEANFSRCRCSLKMAKKKVITLVPKRTPSLNQFRRISKRKTTIRPFRFINECESQTKSSQANICPPGDTEIPPLEDSVLELSHVSEDHNSVHQSSNFPPMSEEDNVASMKNKSVENCLAPKELIAYGSVFPLATACSELDPEAENIAIRVNISKPTYNNTSMSPRLALRNLKDAQLNSPNKSNYYKSNKIDYLEPDIEIGITIATRKNCNRNPTNTNINVSCFKIDQEKKKEEILYCEKGTLNKSFKEPINKINRSMTKTIKYSKNNEQLLLVERIKNMISCSSINNDYSKLSGSHLEMNHLPALNFDGNVSLKRKQTAKDEDLKSHKKKEYLESQINNSIIISDVHSTNEKEVTLEKPDAKKTLKINQKSTVDLFGKKNLIFQPKFNIFETDPEDNFCIKTPNVRKIRKTKISACSSPHEFISPPSRIKKVQKRANSNSFVTLGTLVKQKLKINTLLEQTFSNDSEISDNLQTESLSASRNNKRPQERKPNNKRPQERKPNNKRPQERKTNTKLLCPSSPLLKTQSNHSNKNQTKMDNIELLHNNDDEIDAVSHKNQRQDKRAVKKTSSNPPTKAIAALNIDQLISLGKTATSSNLTDIDVIWTVILNTVQSFKQKSCNSESKDILQHFLSLTKQNLTERVQKNTLMMQTSSKDSEISEDHQSQNYKWSQRRKPNIKMPCPSSPLVEIQFDDSNQNEIQMDSLELAYNNDHKKVTISNKNQRQVKQAKKKNTKRSPNSKGRNHAIQREKRFCNSFFV